MQPLSPSEAERLQQQLLAAQSGDGGWSFQKSLSTGRDCWTEPTALAVIALRAHGNTMEPYRKALAWLACASASGWRMGSEPWRRHVYVRDQPCIDRVIVGPLNTVRPQRELLDGQLTRFIVLTCH